MQTKRMWSLKALFSPRLNPSVQAEAGDATIHQRFVLLRHAYGRLLGSWRAIAGFGIVTAGLWYGATYLVPRSVAFNYSGATCVSETVLFPNLFKTGGTQVAITHEDYFRIGSFELLATKTCIHLTSSPKPTTLQLSSAPFGGPLFGMRYKLHIAEPPKVLAARGKLPVALSKPFHITLNQPDEVHQYYVNIDGATQRCTTQSVQLYCRVDKLRVAQGSSYDATVERVFAAGEPEAVAEFTVDVLPATHVVSTSVQPGEIVYSKPTSITLVADKVVESAQAELSYVDGSGKQTVELETTIVDKEIRLKFAKELAREKQFQLRVAKLTAVDGSGLTEPYILDFQTSGGPKVTAVNIGHASVGQGSQVVVTFDQTLADSLNIASFASIAGGTATVTYSGKQLVFRLQPMAPCTAFTLRVQKGLTGQNGLVGTADWTYDSRVSCRQATQTIGYSVKGRPITAYYYGTGQTTVLFTGGIHGNEYSGYYLMQDWITHLDANAYKLAANRRVVVVPNLSPDGLASNDRYNANGVNLDRNFPSSDWSTDIGIRGGVKPGGGGSSPLSEPEAKAIASLTESLRPRLVMSFHSSGSLVGINKVADSAAIGNVYANAVSYRTMYDNAEAIMGYTFTGEYETWIGEKLGAPAVLIELPTDTGRYFSGHASSLWKMAGM